MYGKLNKNIGFSLIIFAFFFLFEPTYALIDPLPDFIGYSILVIALANLADINDRIAVARRGFLKCILLGALRILSIILLERVFVDDEHTVGLLIFVFVFAFFEIAILIPSYKSLFEGLLSLGVFHDGEAVYKKKREKGRNRTERIYSLTLAFVIIKNVVCALPDFSTLQTNSSYEFINITRILAIIAVIPISIAWLIVIVSYFISLKRDRRFVESLMQKYIEKSQSMPELYVYRPVKTGLWMTIVALTLTFDLYAENVNYLPDLFFYATLILMAIYLKKNSNTWVPLVISSSAGVIFSLLLFAVEKEFFAIHFISAIKRDFEAYQHYYFMLALYLLQALIGVVTILLISRFLYDLFLKHALNENGNESDSRVLLSGVKARIMTFIALGIVSEVACVYHIVALPYFSRGWIYEYSAIISSVISIGFISAAWVLISYIRVEIKNNYKINLI